jgi:L-alanine-DL-glutamate epimerase-like enolase superfamily enzyme
MPGYSGPGTGRWIESAEVVVTSPGRNLVTLRITTEDGPASLGDGTLDGREPAVEACLREHVVPLPIGRDAGRIDMRHPAETREVFRPPAGSTTVCCIRRMLRVRAPSSTRRPPPASRTSPSTCR